jgi:hypothetical protein
MARHFLQAPDHYSVNQALRWGQIRGLGAEMPLAAAIVATRLGASFQNEEYWSRVIRYVIDRPELGATKVGSIVEYLSMNRRLLTQHTLGPKPHELLQKVKQWRTEPLAARRSTSLKWKRSDMSGLEHLDERSDYYSCKWTIRELLDGNQLLDEGRAMRHCVGRYSSKCMKGRASIWSMARSDYREQNRRELTIEVDPIKRAIVQARGMRDARPRPEARRIMLLWAEQEGLKVARSV